VYGGEFEYYEKRQEKEEEMKKEISRRSESDSLGLGVFARIPCIPPWCEFECGALISDRYLNHDHITSTIEPILNITSTTSTSTSATDSVNERMTCESTNGLPTHVNANTFNTTAQYGLFHWPPNPRYCPSNPLYHNMKPEKQIMIRPIWIAIPEERIVDCVPVKVRKHHHHTIIIIIIIIFFSMHVDIINCDYLLYPTQC
jgi:hypothetical protein